MNLAAVAFGLGGAAILHRVRLRKNGGGGGRGGGNAAAAASTADPSSFANPRSVRTTHLDLDLEADFGTKQLRGSVTLTCAVQATTRGGGGARLVLDTRNINVSAIELVSGGGGGGRPVAFAYGEEHENLGTPLEITVPGAWRKGDTFKLRVAYETAAGDACTALQWLPAAQTAGKAHPYLFSQCQAIHARSMVPCQDAPGVKVTYDARLTVPAPLVALMSAGGNGDAPVRCGGARFDTRTYAFAQPVPMPAYLIALAVGDLEARTVGPRSRVWSEPSMVDAGAREFEDTEQYLAAAEEVCGKYVWGQYDLLLLPPSFPYGGMENPMLTFVTPTLLAGDKSLTGVVAHEIAHSWMGNLVTNATWEHFWMNEGFTVFVERKVVARVSGAGAAALSAHIGWAALEKSVALYGADHPFTKLHVDLSGGVDPDDAFSSVPYEKGFNLLYYLEGLVGGPAAFEPFLRAHVRRYQYGTVSFGEWRRWLLSYFADSPDASVPRKLAAVDWDAWVNAPGMPPTARPAPFDRALLDAAYALADAWAAAARRVARGEAVTAASAYGPLASRAPEVAGAWTNGQRVKFLDRLLELQKGEGGAAAVPAEMLRAVGSAYGFDRTRNCELRFRYLTASLVAGDEGVHAAAVAMLTTQGRMKYVRPLYRTLAASGARGRALALRTFRAHRNSYHSICSKMVARDLGADDE